MSYYEYTGTDERHYHDIGTVAPGNKHELPDDPGDGRWKLIKTAGDDKPADRETDK